MTQQEVIKLLKKYLKGLTNKQLQKKTGKSIGSINSNLRILLRTKEISYIQYRNKLKHHYKYFIIKNEKNNKILNN